MMLEEKGHRAQHHESGSKTAGQAVRRKTSTQEYGDGLAKTTLSDFSLKFE
jgi:hypothetical protein